MRELVVDGISLFHDLNKRFGLKLPSYSTSSFAISRWHNQGASPLMFSKVIYVRKISRVFTLVFFIEIPYLLPKIGEKVSDGSLCDCCAGMNASLLGRK